MKAPYKVLDIVALGMHSLMVHKVRSALTSLGIIFGVCGVITMLAISEGASYESQLALRRLGSDNIIIDSVKPPEGGGNSRDWGASHYGLTWADAARLRDNIPGVVECITVHRTAKRAYAGAAKEAAVTVIETEPGYAGVTRLTLVNGRFISDADMLLRKSHCVITAPLARELFGPGDPLGSVIRMDNEPFKIIGIIQPLPHTLIGGAGNAANCVIVPITSARVRYGEYTIQMSQGSQTVEKVEVSQAIMRMKDEQAVVEGAAIARSLLQRKRDKVDYSIYVPLEVIEQRKKQAQIWSYLFLAIASVSLVVAGIGIMNIMLATVTERTREIGIRRALGAKRRDITTQFLVESVTLTTLGGLLGIGIGLVAPWAVERLLNFKTIVSPPTLMIPLIMAVAVGLISGLYPALRAAKLDPIIALRHE